MSKYINNPVPSTLPIESMEVGYTKSLLRYGISTDADISGVVFWAKNVTDNGAEQKTVLPYDINARSFLIESLDIGKEYSLQGAFLDEFAESNPVLIDTKSPEILSIFNVPNYTTKTPATVESVQVLSSDLGQIGSPSNSIALHTAGEASEMLVEILPAEGLTGTDASAYDWSEATVLYRGIVNAEDVITLSAPAYGFVMRVTSKHVFSNGLVDIAPVTYLGDAENPIKAEDATAEPSTPTNLDVTAIRVTGSVDSYDMAVAWDWAAAEGTGARRNALVSYRVQGTSEWKTETALGNSHTFVGVPYRKALDVKVQIKGWNGNDSQEVSTVVFISSRSTDSAETGYLVPIPDTNIPVATNVQVTDAGIRAFKNWDGTSGDVTFYLDADNGNVTIGTTDEYDGVAPFTFNAATGILSIKGQTITDEIVAADYVMGWLGGNTPTFRTANRTADGGFSENTSGIWMGYEDDTTFKFALGDGSQKITWDGTTLRISGNVVVGDSGNRTIDQAQRYIQVYRRAANKPVTPTTGSFDNPVPSGWSRTVPEYDGNPCWMVSRTFTSDGEYPQTTWEEPSKIAEAIDVARLVTLTADQQVIKFDSAGQPDVTEVTITPSVQNISNPQYQWSFSGGTGTIAPDNGSVTIPYTAFGASSQAITVTVLVPTPEGDRTDSITIIRVQDGGIGESTFSGYLTNESHTIAANSDGTVPSYAGATGQCKAFYGGADVTSECSFVVGEESAGLTVTVNSSGVYQVTSLTQDSGTAPIIITHPTYGSVTKVLSVAKAKTGIQGVKGDDSYFHVAFADSADGTENFNFTEGKYIGTYTSTSSTSSTNPSAYNWVRVKGYDALLFEDNTSRTVPTSGEPVVYTFDSEYEGPAILSFYGFDFENGIVVSVNGTPITPNASAEDQVTKWYHYEIDVELGTNEISFVGNSSDGGGVRKLLVALGNRGIPGTDGDNGETSYLHIAYADSADGTLNFNQASGLYIGQYVDFTAADSSNPADYNWARMKGSDGLGTVTWKLLGGAELLEGSAIKGGSNTDWTSAAISDQKFDTAVIQTTATLQDRVMVGFVDSTPDTVGWSDMAFAILHTTTGDVRIYESAGLKYTVGGTYPSGSTTVGVRMRDNVVEYIVNGNVVYTSTKVPDSTYNAKISFSSLNDIARDIAVAPIGLSGKDANPNLIDPNLHWVIGTSGTQGIYSKNGSNDENEIIQDRGPTGHAEAIWLGKNGTNSGDGGWNTEEIPVSQNHSYRFSVWMKQIGGKNNTCYLGTRPRALTHPEGELNTNPYFWSGDLQELDKWYLVVGIVHSRDYDGEETGLSGVYDPVTGKKVADGNEFRQDPGTVALAHRAYRYYATDDTNTVKFARPRMEKLDGSEASLASLLGVQPIVDSRAHGTFYLEYTGTWTTTVNDSIAAAASAVVTNGTPKLDDVVIVSNANNAEDAPYHIRYTGGDPSLASGWDKISMVVHGDALVEGTVLADRVVAGVEITAPIISGGRLEIGGSSKVILDGSNVDSPIEVLDSEGGLVLGWDQDVFRFRGGLGTGKIDNMSVFSQHIQNIIAPPIQNALGGTFTAPNRGGNSTTDNLSTSTEVFEANDKDVLISCSVSLSGVGNKGVLVRADLFIDRSINGGSWTNIHTANVAALPGNEPGFPEYHRTDEITYTDVSPAAVEGDTLAYRLRLNYVSGAGTSYSSRIFDIAVAQQVTGGGVAGNATSATFPYVGLDTQGSSSYPRMFPSNNPGSSNAWVRVWSGNGGLLPYADGQSNIGSDSWRFNSVHSNSFFENGVQLQDKYLGILDTANNSSRVGGLTASQLLRSDVEDTKSGKLTIISGDTIGANPDNIADKATLVINNGGSSYLGFDSNEISSNSTIIVTTPELDVRAPITIQNGIQLQSPADETLRLQNAGGYIDIGAKNSSYAHIYTDLPEFYFNKELRVNGGRVWHSGIDGAGSGLDADTVDGAQLSELAILDAANTFTKTVRISTSSGLDSLIIGGDTTLNDRDARILIGNGTYNYSLTYEGTGSANTNAFVLSSNDHEIFKSNIDGVLHIAQLGTKIAGNTVWHAGNDGSGSGLDSDTVDGIQASQLLRTDIPSVFSPWLDFTGAMSARYDGAKVLKAPRDGYFQDRGSVSTGAVKITLPVTWTSTMISMEVELYNYHSGKTATYVVGGYNYASSGNEKWVNTFAKVISGDFESNIINVRFGHDGTNCLIYLGELDRETSYLGVTIHRVTLQYNNYLDSEWNNSWGITLEDTEFLNVTATKEVQLLATNSLKLGGVLAENFARTDVSETFTSPEVLMSPETVLKAHGGTETLGLKILRRTTSNSGDDIMDIEVSDSAATFTIDNRDDAGNGTFYFRKINTDGSTSNIVVAGATLFTYQGNTVWHAGNDGSGSGLDADTVDGIHGTQIARTDISETFEQDVAVQGKLVADGGLRSGGHDILNGSDTWLRTKGATGWYNTTYDGGIYMSDTTWIRTYSGKRFYINNTHATQALKVEGGITTDGRVVVDNPSGEGGIVGSYTNTGSGIDQIIWTIGTNWATHAKHYGMGYHYGPELGGDQHQIVYKHNGTTNARIGLYGFAWFGQSVDSPVIKENGINIADKYLNVNSLNYNSPETWAAAWTAVEQFKEWVSSGDADTSGYSTVTDSIATGFINSVIGNFNVVVADNANVGYLTARAIEVTGRQKLINNPSATKHPDTWIKAENNTSVGSSANPVAVQESELYHSFTVNGRDTTTLRLVTSDNASYSPAPVEVDHNAIYKVSMLVYVGGNTQGNSTRYIGFVATDTADRETAVPKDILKYDGTTRQPLSGNTENFYAVNSDAAWSTRTYYTMYVVGANRSVDEVPDTNLPIGKLTEGTTHLFLRILNWNVNAETIMHVYNPSISEIQTGTIVAHNIKADAITADKIAANSVNASHIQSNTITASQIASATITANKIASNTITANQIAANAITASELSANSVTSDHIVARTIQATDIASGTITSEEIKANSILASRILVSSENVFPDYDSMDESFYEPRTAGSSFFLTTTGNSGFGIQRVRMHYLDSQTNYIQTKEFTLEGGAEYNLQGKMYLETAGPTMVMYIETGTRDHTGAITWGGLQQKASTTSTSGFNTFNITFGAATTTRVARLVFSVTASTASSYGSFGAITLRRRLTGSLIVDGAITANHIQSNTITANEIAANTITASQIAANAITASELAANSVNASHIVANSITASEIAANAITASELAAGSVNATHIQANSITASQIAANAITTSELAAGSVTASKLVLSGANVYPDYDMRDDSFYTLDTGVTASIISTGLPNYGARRMRIYARTDVPARVWTAAIPVDNGNEYYFSARAYAENGNGIAVYYQVGTLNNDNSINWDSEVLIGNTSSTSSYNYMSTIISLNSSSARRIRFILEAPVGVTGDFGTVGAIILRKRDAGELIVDGAIEAKHIKSNTITASEIAANAITASELAANSVNASHIVANSITASEIDVSTITIDSLSWQYGSFGSTSTDIDGTLYGTYFRISSPNTGWDNTAAAGITVDEQDDVGLVIKHNYDVASAASTGRGLYVETGNAVGAVISSSRSVGLSVVGGKSGGAGALSVSTNSYSDNAIVVGIGKTLLGTTRIGGSIESRFLNDPMLSVSRPSTSVNQTVPTLEVTHSGWLTGVDEAPAIIATGKSTFKGAVEILPESANPGSTTEAAIELVADNGHKARHFWRSSDNNYGIYIADPSGNYETRVRWAGNTGNWGFYNSTYTAINTDHGYIRIGPQSSSFGHFYTDRGAFYFNKQLYVAGDVTFFYSDERLKTVHSALDSAQALESILSWKPVRYTGNLVAKENGFDSEGVQIGLLAQDIERSYPELTPLAPFDDAGDGVSKSGQEYKTLKYERTTAVLVSALQEETKQRKALEDRLAKMEALIEKLLEDK